jgi:CHAT domain-containing protein
MPVRSRRRHHQSLRQRAVERVAPAKTLAVLADPVCSPQDDRLPVTVRDADPPPEAWSPSFISLPHTRREAESILAMVPPPQRLAALDFAAAPELVKSGELRNYRILHFATHGLLDEVHPELSAVVLSMFDEDGRRRDGHLRLHEIYTLQLPADLVVLSACQTALGRRVRGEGLVGLTHGFFYAGASRLVVSLWDVHDEATAELMTAFYGGLLREDLSPPTALRAAQQRMRRQKRWEAAYYWAGFVLGGDWR